MKVVWEDDDVKPGVKVVGRRGTIYKITKWSPPPNENIGEHDPHDLFAIIDDEFIIRSRWMIRSDFVKHLNAEQYTA